MPLLEYQISATGEDQLKRVLRSVESETKAHARRLDAVSRRTTTAKSAASSVDKLEQKRQAQTLRGIAQIGTVARREDDRIHRERITRMQKERSQSLRGFVEIGKAARAEEDKRLKHAIRSAERERTVRQRTAERAARGIARTAGGAVTRAGRTIVGLGSLAAGAVGFGALAAGKSAVEDEIDIRARASSLANQAAANPNFKGNLGQLKKDLVDKDARGVKGFTGGETLGALEQFTNLTGDLDTARAILPDLGKLALATGTDLGELAATAGNAFIPLADKIKDPIERMKALKTVVTSLANQGAVGAIEIKDLASEFAGLAASSNRFAGKADDNLKIMGALAQAARQRGGAESASEAVTSVARFSSDVITKSGDLKKMGVDVFSDKTKTKLKDPREIILDVLKKTGGDLSKVGDIFGERGIRAFQGFAPLYTEAESKKKGTGEKAVRAEYSRLMGQGSATTIDQRAESRLADPDLQLKEAMKEFRRAIGAELMPEVTRLIPKFKEMIPSLVKLTSAVVKLAAWFGANPFKGVIAIMGASIAKDLLTAGIGKLVEKALGSIFKRAADSFRRNPAAPGVSAVSGGGGGVTARGSKSGWGRAASAAGIVSTFAGAGLLGWEMGSEMGDEAAHETSDPLIHAATVRRDIAGNKLSRNEMFNQKQSLQDELAGLQKGPGIGATIFGGISSLFGGKSAGENNKEAQAEVQTALSELNAELEKTKNLGLDQTAAELTNFTANLAEASERLATMQLPDVPNPRRTNPVLDR